MTPSNDAEYDISNRDHGQQPINTGSGNLSYQTGQRNYLTIISNARPGLEIEATEPSRIDIIDWLEPHSFGVDQVRYHRSLVAQRVSGTGDWVLPKIDSWVNGSDKLVWLSGVFGSGKTMISSIIIEHLQHITDVDIICIYSYCHGTSVTIERLVVDLLRQMVQSQQSDKLCQELIKIYKDFKCRRREVSFEDYMQLIQAVSESFSTIYLVIDGLEDLSMAEAGKGSMESVLRLVEQLNSQPNLKALITSRSGDCSGYHFKVDRVISIELQEADVRTYIRSRIHGDRELSGKIRQGGGKRYEERVVSQVAGQAQGIFLMTKLHMDHLCHQAMFGSLEPARYSLSKTISSAFRASIAQIKQKDAVQETLSLRDLARHVLTWVVNAVTPLTTKQIGQAFSLAQSGSRNSIGCMIPGSLRLVSVCAGLVTRDPQTDELRLVHGALHQHLAEQRVILDPPHKTLAKVCITCLLLDDWPEKSEDGFVAYCATHWIRHYRKAEQDEGRSEELEDMAMELLRSKTKISRMFQVSLGAKSEGITGLHAAAYYNRRDWVSFIMETGFNVDTPCADGQTTLHWAAKYGRYEVVQSLVKNGASLNARCGNRETGDTPLHLAFLSAGPFLCKTVKELAVAGARGDLRGTMGWTPLSRALKYGPMEVAQLLAKYQGDVNAEDDHGWTSLRDAITEGKFQIVVLLLQREADPNQRSSADQWTPLRAATQLGDVQLVELLLEYGANVNQRDEGTGFSPLRWAIHHSQVSVAELLIRRGADLHDTAADGTSLLWEALNAKVDPKEKEIMVWTLLHNHVSPDGRNSKDETPLHHAVKHKSPSLGWLLITHDAKVNLKDGEGRTPLNWAIASGMQHFCWLLCEYGARFDLPDRDGVTAFHQVAGLGHEELLHYFLSRGRFDIDHTDGRGWTAVHHASRHAKIQVLELLRLRGASLNSRNHDGKLPLDVATTGETRRILMRLGSR